ARLRPPPAPGAGAAPPEGRPQGLGGRARHSCDQGGARGHARAHEAVELGGVGVSGEAEGESILLRDTYTGETVEVVGDLLGHASSAQDGGSGRWTELFIYGARSGKY